MTQKSELTPNENSGISLIPKLVFEKLQNEALARGLGWEMLCDIGECSGNGNNIYDPNVRNRRIIFTEDSLHAKHIRKVSFCIELDRWFKEQWNKGDLSEEDTASCLVDYIITELDSLRSKRENSNEEERLIPGFFVEMFQEHGIAAIQREAPRIPQEWVEEYAKTDDFRYLCEAAAQCCRSFCDFLHKKLDHEEEK